MIVSVSLSQAQIAKNAMGLRFGGGNGYGPEISYQRGLRNINRLEFDLGLNSGRSLPGLGFNMVVSMGVEH